MVKHEVLSVNFGKSTYTSPAISKAIFTQSTDRVQIQGSAIIVCTGAKELDPPVDEIFSCKWRRGRNTGFSLCELIARSANDKIFPEEPRID